MIYRTSQNEMRLDAFWEEAFDSLGNDSVRRQEQGYSIDQAPPVWFLTLGADFSSQAVAD
jgi:hypothetical protein